MPKSAERCREIREETRNLIIQRSVLYFARHGFDGTKISDLSKHIGISQGTIYLYFRSKEELYTEIYSVSYELAGSEKLAELSKLPVTPDLKIKLLSDYIIRSIKKDEMFSAGIVIYTQSMIDGEKDMGLLRTTEKIIREGQREGTVVSGNARKLSEFYWGVAFLYANKLLHATDHVLINSDDLSRLLLRERR